MCGNLERKGFLARGMPGMGVDERVFRCRRNFKTFCQRLFGEEFQSYYLSTQQFCGQPLWKYDRARRVNYVSYQTVRDYVGTPAAICERTFKMLLVLLLFVWAMLLTKEFREIWNMLMVICAMTVSESDSFDFEQMPARQRSEKTRFNIIEVPRRQKVLGFLIVMTRSAIAALLLVAGTYFLTSTDSLLNLILNSTALGFLLEIDNLIHHAFFDARIMNKFHKMEHKYSSPCQCIHTPHMRFLITFAVVVAYVRWTYTKHHGFIEIAEATNCLCHLESNATCLAARILRLDDGSP